MEDRIMELEIRLTHADDTIEQLSQTIIRQQAAIDALTLRLGKLDSKLENAINGPDEDPSQEPPPPHY